MAVGEKSEKSGSVSDIKRKLEIIVFVGSNGSGKSTYVLAADSMINVMHVKTRIAAGGHDVPENNNEI